VRRSSEVHGADSAESPRPNRSPPHVATLAGDTIAPGSVPSGPALTSHSQASAPVGFSSKAAVNESAGLCGPQARSRATANRGMVASVGASPSVSSATTAAAPHTAQCAEEADGGRTRRVRADATAKSANKATADWSADSSTPTSDCLSATSSLSPGTPPRGAHPASSEIDPRKLDARHEALTPRHSTGALVAAANGKASSSQEVAGSSVSPSTIGDAVPPRVSLPPAAQPSEPTTATDASAPVSRPAAAAVEDADSPPSALFIVADDDEQ
jgi:hypothetical protein